MERWSQLQEMVIGGDARADEICQLLTNEADTDLRRSVLLQRLVDVLGEGFTPLSAQMQLQWMLLEDAVASGDSTATHLLSFLASARGSPVVALARLTKGVGAKDWRNISPGVAEMLMRDVPEAVEVYDDNSEEEQGVVACPWTEQAEAAELEAAANISHDFVDEDPIAEQPDDDHLDEQADANEEVPQILFDRVNPVAVEEIGKRVLSKVFRTGNGNGPTVMRICGDILAQCTRGKVAGARCFRTTYREEKGMVAIGKKGRRFSGHPNWLRSLLRSGLPGHFVFDLENCHLAVLRERHQPAADSALETYFQDRERILRDTHADRTVAKQLFLRLLYGGSILAWKRTHRLGEFATEQFAERFAAEMAAMRQADCQNHTQLLAKLRQRTARPVEKASEKILIRDLTDYHIEWTTSEQDAGFRSNTRWEFTGQTFQNGVANWLKSNLGESSAAFDVDGESCRKYLNFSGKVLNSETLVRRQQEDAEKRRIGPIPPKCLAFLEEEMHDPVLSAVTDFVATKLERAPRGGATPREEVHKALHAFVERNAPVEDGKRREVRCGELLKQLGVLEKRGRGGATLDGRRKNTYYLIYIFPKTDGSKDSEASFVRLVSGAEPAVGGGN
ncbi:unnamed protein product [Effrenium voratum]|nr:unnamed protein product [Effrenium voratum]